MRNGKWRLVIRIGMGMGMGIRIKGKILNEDEWQEGMSSSLGISIIILKH